MTTQSTSPVADLVIDTLALSEAELLERVASLEADRDSYRDLAHQAIHALHAVTQELRRTRGQRDRIRDAFRAFRERLGDGDERRSRAA